MVPARHLAPVLLELTLRHQDWEATVRGLLVERAAELDAGALAAQREGLFALAARHLEGRFPDSAPLEAILRMGPGTVQAFIDSLWRRPALLARLPFAWEEVRLLQAAPTPEAAGAWLPWLEDRLRGLDPGAREDLVRFQVLAGVVAPPGPRRAPPAACAGAFPASSTDP